MSEKLCTLRTKGGGGGAKVVETVLWTNPSPSSNFSAQTVTLSDSIDNYDYIKISYNYSSTVAKPYSDIMPVSVFKQGVYPQQDQTPLMALGCYSGGTATARGVMYASSTTVRFSPANNVAATGTSDNRAIPTAIIGIKNMGGKEQGSDWATISVATTGTSNVCTGYAVASNSNKFTASYTNGSASGTITVLEEGLYDYAFTKANRGTGTATVKIGNQSYDTGKGEIYIAANTVCTASVGGTAGSLGLACITLVKKS